MKRKSDAFQRVSLQDHVAIQFHNQSLESGKKSPIYWSVFRFTHGAPSICPSAFLHLCTSRDALSQKWPQRREIGTSERRNGKRMPFESMCGKGRTIHISHRKNYLNSLCPYLVNSYSYEFNIFSIGRHLPPSIVRTSYKNESFFALDRPKTTRSKLSDT